jgi:hypothetical protein
MSDEEGAAPGTIIGLDLTVPDAAPIRDFYAAVVGWEIEPFDMDGYEDYFMKAPATGDIVAGVCYARGENADLPPMWLNYVVVEDLDASLQRCIELGGAAVSAIKEGGDGARFCVIRDPAWAMIALMELGEEE